MAKKLFIKTHGCQMNEYDSARMADLLKTGEAVEVTDNADDADILLLNTCSIREKAQEKVFHQLGRWKSLKTKKPDLIIGVGGCVASQEGQAIIDRAPYVDMVFGPQTLHRLPDMITEVRTKGNGVGVVDVSFPEIEKFDNLPEPGADGPSPLWKAAANTAPSAWCPTPVAKKSAARWTTSSPKWPIWPPKACAK
jgi:tRNA-2-methylthio-N6-dimethylallyladenosine synthase